LRQVKKNKTRVIDISTLATIIGRDALTVLLGVYAWNGCDSTSAFYGQGKTKAFDLIRLNDTFHEAFFRLGEEWNVADELFSTLDRFTCSMYSRSAKSTTVNDKIYEIFRFRNIDVSPGQLPSCKNALHQHTKRSNYQAATGLLRDGLTFTVNG
jgi:hypothetical protein